MNRRKFFTTSAGLAGAFAVSHGILAAPARKSSLTPQEFQAKIVGPVLSVPTCYRQDLSLDMQGMRRIVELGISSGCGIVTLTAGNNQYDLLSYDEIKDLTREIIDAVDGRAVMIAATGKWETDQAVDYAKLRQRPWSGRIAGHASCTRRRSHDRALRGNYLSDASGYRPARRSTNAADVAVAGNGIRRRL